MRAMEMREADGDAGVGGRTLGDTLVAIVGELGASAQTHRRPR